MFTFRNTVKLTFLLICVCGLLGLFSQSARADDFSQWHYHADATALPQADDTYDAIYADFTHLLTSTFNTSGTLDENSIRVVALKEGQPGVPVPYRFVKDAAYNAASNAAGTLIFEVAATADSATEQYRVYFDTKSNGAKSAFQNSEDVPQTANMIWNSSFEILSQDYKGTNRYANPGENMPRGWWGNLQRSVLTNKATSAHSGDHALAIVSLEDGKNISVASAPSPPALRLTPGQSYAFSFWIKGEGLTSNYPLYASVYWYDKDQKFLTRTNIAPDIDNKNDFDWTKTEVYLAAPKDAYYGSMYIGTYSSTGLLTIDDLDIHVAVPPLLQ